MRLGFFSVAAVVMFLTAVLMLGSTLGVGFGLLAGPLPSRDFPVVVVAILLAAAGVVLFGSTSVQMAQRLFGSSAPVVFMTENGFKDLRISSEWIPWQAILSVRDPRRGKGGRGFYIEVDRRFAAKLPLSFTSRFLQAASRPFGYNGLWVITVTLKASPDGTLFDTMRKRVEPPSAA